MKLKNMQEQIGSDNESSEICLIRTLCVCVWGGGGGGGGM